MILPHHVIYDIEIQSQEHSSTIFDNKRQCHPISSSAETE